ncbi:hypothetical protein QE152_g9142 [Popillia japonica]|uniref:Uncharacterized protein n=1 Tax=Popillia japonica TaxID=7064 RepID=A0AAW1M009_POPJA
MTQPSTGYDRVDHRNLLSPKAILIKKLVYLRRGPRGRSDNCSHNPVRAVNPARSATHVQVQSMDFIEEFDDLIKIINNLNKSSENQKQIASLLKGIKGRLVVAE